MSGDVPHEETLPSLGDLDDGELGALVALAGLPGMSPPRLRSLLAAETPREAWVRVCMGQAPHGPLGRATVERWRADARSVDPASLLDRHRTSRVEIWPLGSSSYPRRLIDDPDPPAVVFAKGPSTGLVTTLDPVVAIVGTRRCTRYGRDVANELATGLAARGVGIASGLAHGIDAAAHRGPSLVGVDRCLAVVAGGVDVVYPRGNRDLWGSIIAGGLLVSEWPLGSVAVRWRFPARNRLIAALSDAVVVIESGVRGGSMYTVDEALRRDRRVLSVPGPISSRSSAGTNRLVADGAEVLFDVDAFIGEFGGLSTAAADRETEPMSWLLTEVPWTPTSLDSLVATTGRSPGEVSLELERLIAGGWLARTGMLIERIR